MKNYLLIFVVLQLLLSVPLLNAKSNETEQNVLILKGRVIAADTRMPLSNATLTVENSNVSGITNQDGYFTLRVPETVRNSKLTVRFLGYENMEIPIVTLVGKSNDNIALNPSPIELGTVEIVSGDGTELVREALARVAQNYSADPKMMIAFYRESIKKNSNYISLVEAVLDVYKASYKSFEGDQEKIYIGRKATDISPRDTVLMKFQGGISAAMMLDVAKNPDIIFGANADGYSFQIERLININNKPNYVIDFSPLPGIQEILFRGKIYLDVSTLAFSRVEFNMNVEGRKDATNIFIRKKPAKMKVDVEEARYVADFVESNGTWYFNYSSTEVKFKVRWTNRFFGLFSTSYIIGSEIAVTDRYENGVSKFPRKERIHSSDVIAEKVEYFQDPDFWGEYNVIEPDLEITKAIKRLSGKLSRRAE